jgi:hypothetical protein
MLPREMRTAVMPGAFDACSPADESIEAAKVPPPPTQHVLPKANGVALSLILWAWQATAVSRSVLQTRGELGEWF